MRNWLMCPPSPIYDSAFTWFQYNQWVSETNAEARWQAYLYEVLYQ